MNKNKKNYAFKIVGIAVAILLVGSFALGASDSMRDEVVDRIAEKWLQIEQEGLFGAITMDKSTFEHGIEVSGEGLDITGGDLDVDVSTDFSSDVTSNATTTIQRLDASFQTALNFQVATSENSGVADSETQRQLGYIENTGNDLLCTDVWLDISTANNLYAYDLKVGTSTSATSSDAHLIDETNDSNAIATTSTDLLSKEDDEGTSTEDTWVFEGGTFIVVTELFQTANATRSEAFTTAGGNTGAGRLHVNCRSRY